MASAKEDAPSLAQNRTYELLHQHGLLQSQWLKQTVDDLDFRAGNATRGGNALRWAGAIFFPPACCMMRTKSVPSGTVVRMQDGRGGFDFLGNRGALQGVHYYWDAFYQIDSKPVALNDPADEGLTIRNGDRWIVIVPQGSVGLAYDVGQPILLPPGMHQWQSATMKFERGVDLNQPVIELGPYTVLTVDKGYEAVTQNNGEQQVMPGGAVHLLDHRQWRFEKFIPTKIQTDDLHRIEVMTGDNVLMHVDATVCWQISDVRMCAERAAETMSMPMPPAQAFTSAARPLGPPGRPPPPEPAGMSDYRLRTDGRLRTDVLKQAEASLSALVGKVHFSGTFSAAAAVQVGQTAVVTSADCAPSIGPADLGGADRESQLQMLFDLDKLTDAVTHANDMTSRYGVEVLSINIISAKPADATLREALATGAVAAAQAQQIEIAARGKAKAKAIESQGYADALRISALADSEAEVTRAEGSKQAAALLNTESVAVELAKINATGSALALAKSSLILNTEPSKVGSMLLANPNVVPRQEM